MKEISNESKKSARHVARSTGVLHGGEPGGEWDFFFFFWVEREGGHSVVVVQFHDDLTTDPSSHHIISTVFVHNTMIPQRASLESVELDGRPFVPQSRDGPLLE